MMSFNIFPLLVFLVIIGASCNTASAPTTPISKIKIIAQTTIHENGNTATLTHFRSGKRDSVYREWFPNGKLQVERYYNMGEMEREKLFSIEGKVLQNITIKDGRKYGLLFSSFCMNGVVKNPELDTIIFESKN